MTTDRTPAKIGLRMKKWEKFTEKRVKGEG